MTLDDFGDRYPLKDYLLKIIGRRYAMNWDVLMEVWDSFMTFMDRVVAWLMYLFGAGPWPPEEWPDIDDEN